MAGGGGGGGGRTWIAIMAVGALLCGAGYAVEHAEAGPGWLAPALLAVGGLGVVFGSCEALIKCVEGVGQRLGWNPFVAGTVAGLASNLPEIVMLGFVVAAAPRVAFVVVALTLHVNALAFGAYSALLPRDRGGHARLPEALVKISTDLFAAGGGALLAMGSLMVVMKVFATDQQSGEGFAAIDLYLIGAALLAVQAVSVVELLKRFGGAKEQPDPTGETASERDAADAPAPNTGPSWASIAGYAAIGMVASLLGGHAVGDFADALVGALREAGQPEMVGAILLSVFAGTGAFVMLIMAHAKKLYDVALAGASGAVTQVSFVVLPAVMILMAVLAQSGVIPTLPSGAVLPIDLETTSVVLLAFPTNLILWKSVQDDGKVSWLETAGMVAVFGLTIYFLARHG